MTSPPDYSSRAKALTQKLILLMVLALLFGLAAGTAKREFLHVCALPGVVLQQILGKK